MIKEYLKNNHWIKYNNDVLPKKTKIKFICKTCNREKTCFIESFSGVCGYCKRKNSLKQKYGVENVFQLEKVKNKIKKTNIKRYGVENISQDLNTKIKKDETKKKTNLEKYGVENVFQLEEVKEKIKQTNIEKYGAIRAISREEIKEKMFSTNIEKYGTKIPSQNYEVKEKMKKSISLTIDERANNKKTNFIKNLDLDDLEAVPLFSFEEYKGTAYKNKYLWKCKKCGFEFKYNLYSGRRPKCPICIKSDIFFSNQEKELKDFVSSLEINFICNTRSIISPLELDIYIPDHKLAIEYNGLYWHSDQFKGKEYHLFKTLQCEKLGIQLIHIFEDEWLFKKDIVKARLRNLLGKNSRRIGARQTTIKEIDPKTKNQFLEKYHIQGKDGSSIKLGAYYEKELIGVMTFSKPRIFMGKKYKEGLWELSRFATISDTYTPGLAGKMLKYFERNFNWLEIYSYADRRWSQGNLYRQIGFEYDSETKPNYFYANQKDLIRKHRYNYRKSELKKFENYNSDKTEFEIMNEAGYLRIYDCGNLKFIKRKDV